jgi:hypothetical protein
MIEMGTAIDSLRDTGESPYRDPADVQANEENYVNPYDDMLAQMREQTILLKRLTESTERQRANPGFSEALIGTGAFPSTVAYRPVYLIFTVSAACTVTITYGSSVQRVLNIPSADTRVMPWTLAISRGTDVAITASAGTVSGWFLGYPE